MYEAFKAEQCVTIHEPDKFMRRVAEAFYEKFNDRGLYFGGIDYLDPYLGDGKKAIIPFCKPLRYFYQAEIRYVVVPHKELVGHIEPFSIKIGSIEDIAEMVIQQ